MAYNKERAERFKKRSVGDLERIRDSGSLAAAAADFELRRRSKNS